MRAAVRPPQTRPRTLAVARAMATPVTRRIGFIGAGQMAEALARGFVDKGVCGAADIFATDPVAERREVFRTFGTNPRETNKEVRAM